MIDTHSMSKIIESNGIEALNPSVYFEQLKSKKNQVTDADLDRFYDNSMQLLLKAQKTGQINLMRRLVLIIDCIEKERELVKAGINTFVYQEDVTYYIKNVAKKVVKIIELENYPREIPDEIVEVIEKYGHLFNQMYVVFTDYTGEVEKAVKKKDREKDPILFGTFQTKGSAPTSKILNERFYFLGDWVDPYCDLTLDKMVYEMKRAGKSDIKQKAYTPTDLDGIRKELDKLEAKERNVKLPKTKKKNGFFDKVETFLFGE